MLNPMLRAITIKDFKSYRLHPQRRVLIWSLDHHLSSYDTHAPKS